MAEAHSLQFHYRDASILRQINKLTQGNNPPLTDYN